MVPNVERTTTPQATAPAPTARNWSLLLRVLGVAMALGGGLALGSGLPGMALPDVLFWLFVLALVVWAALAAALLRTLLAVFIVPVLSVAGLFLASAVHNHGFDVQAWFTGGLGDIDIVAFYVVLPWAIGAVIGTPLGAWLEERIPG